MKCEEVVYSFGGTIGKQNFKMTIIIKERAIKKMKEYTRQMGNDEIGGLLTGKINDTGDFIVMNAVLLKQKKSLASFQIDEENMMELTKNGNAKFLASIIGWWHSHGNGTTFWSPVDDACFERLCGFLNEKCFGIVLVNELFSTGMKSRLDIWDRTGNFISIDDIKPEIEDDGRIHIQRKAITDEIKRKVADEPVGFEQSFKEEIEEPYGDTTQEIMEEIDKDEKSRLPTTNWVSGYRKF